MNAPPQFDRLIGGSGSRHYQHMNDMEEFPHRAMGGGDMDAHMGGMDDEVQKAI